MSNRINKYKRHEGTKPRWRTDQRGTHSFGITTFMSRRSFAVTAMAFFLLMSVSIIAAADTYYVCASASGAGNGSDWQNAYNYLPPSLVRGATYYVADGIYPGYTFDDSVNGTQLITIKKATGVEHGTDNGWQNSYGDGQAVFNSGLEFASDYWVVDGVTRDEDDWSNSGAYGFVIDGGAGGPGHSSDKLINGSYAKHITVRYVYAFYDQVWMGYEESYNHGYYSLTQSEDVLLERCGWKNISWKAVFLINYANGPVTIRYNYIENAFRKELVSSRDLDNLIFAFNRVKNVAGTGALIAFTGCDNWQIYGNTFWSPNNAYDFTDVIMGTQTGDAPDLDETMNNCKIYCNTFYQMRGATQIQIQKGSGNEVRNNLFIGFTSSISGALTASNNLFNAPTTLVEDAAGGDFRLTAATGISGLTLSSPYGIDMNGVVRGEDGHWDVGAYEYPQSPGSGPSVVLPPSNLRIMN